MASLRKSKKRLISSKNILENIDLDDVDKYINSDLKPIDEEIKDSITNKGSKIKEDKYTKKQPADKNISSDQY